MTLRIGWFATARGTTSAKLLRAALEAIDAGMDARISFVFSNRDPGDFENTDRFFDEVRAAGIPLVTLSNTKFRRRVGGKPSREGEPLPEWRREYDAEIAKLVEPYGFDLGVAAGYMLIFTDVLYQRWPLINLHGAAPDGPIGVWQDVVWQLIEQRASESGVLIFLADGNLDRGPVVTYCRYSLRGPGIDELWAKVGDRTVAEIKSAEGEDNPLFQEVRARGVAREIPLLVETLRGFADGRFRIRSVPGGFEVTDAEGRPLAGVDLSQRVEELVAGSPGLAAPETPAAPGP
ncbi:MAG TPA: formyltransferase family protein [Dehalococcoidia bacterium]|nr:formyltransferase family protein [Dehalococcoidia bacterium]